MRTTGADNESNGMTSSNPIMGLDAPFVSHGSHGHQRPTPMSPLFTNLPSLYTHVSLCEQCVHPMCLCVFLYLLIILKSS